MIIVISIFTIRNDQGDMPALGILGRCASWLSQDCLPGYTRNGQHDEDDYQDDIFLMIIMIMAMIFLMLRWKIPTWKWQWWATRPAVGSPSPVLRFFSSLWKVKVKVDVKEIVHVCIQKNEDSTWIAFNYPQVLFLSLGLTYISHPILVAGFQHGESGSR